MFKSMKRVFSIATLVALLSLSMGAAAQTVFGGEIISPVNMSHMEAAKFSQTEQSFLSARVSAMGGAFTSLGADLSSMAINPAGLGMYRSSALSFSMSFDNTRSTNGNVNYATNKSQTSFNQVGTALNLYQGTGSLVSFTLGFAYNQLADLNYRNSASWNNGEVTIGEFFAEQMYGINPSDLSSQGSPFTSSNIYPDEWGGVLAYRTFFIDPVIENNTFMGGYMVTGVPLENKVDSRFVMESMGSVGEYDLSAGMNFGNVLYLGATLGIQSIEQIVYYDYDENYRGASGESEISSMSYQPTLANYGSGVNFKIGAILRPVQALRIGVAYHSPTSVSLTKDYSTAMRTTFANGRKESATSYVNSFTYDYSSPSKLLLGASLTLADRAILSVDYDRVWYDGMTMKTKGLEDIFADDVAYDLGSANNFRVGLEVVPVANLYLRGGYAYYGSPLNSAATAYYEEGNPFYGTFKTHSDNFSLGAGWRFASGTSLDIVWTLSRAHYTNSMMYYYSYTDESQSINVEGPTLMNTKHQSNTIGVTYTTLF